MEALFYAITVLLFMGIFAIVGIRTGFLGPDNSDFFILVLASFIWPICLIVIIGGLIGELITKVFKL